jgi:hypothetical protein
MGQLDDAIREHLDLKRRRGADPAEVERDEHEALGPVRRGPDPEAAAVALGEPAALEVAGEEDWDEEFDDVEEFPPPPAAERHAPAEPPSRERHAMAGPPAAPPPLEDELPDRDPAPTAPPTPPPPSGGDTVEYKVEGERPRGGEQKGEDPLEETPEFLQDTPEHDRLWFEQRPPRDFDFNG